jgi:hypothetical protein
MTKTAKQTESLRNTNAPVLTEEQEQDLLRRRGALERLGASLKRVTLRCSDCGCAYLAGSTHRHSDWCNAMSLRRQLKKRGLSPISANYLDWLRKLNAPFEVHLTALRREKGSYRSLGLREKRIWIPSELASVLGKTIAPAADRMLEAERLIADRAPAWAAAPMLLEGRFAAGRAAMDQAVFAEHSRQQTACRCAICRRLRPA